MIEKKLKKLEKEFAPKIERKRNDIEKPLSLKDWTNEELEAYIFASENNKNFGTKVPKFLKDKEEKTNFNIYDNLSKDDLEKMIDISIDEIIKVLN